ncbi:hypothetical protein P5V15_008514 [Pogonomyrmex californicus]
MAIVLVSFIVGVFVALYIYLTRNYKHWQKHGIPTIDEALPGFGHMLPVISMKTYFGDFCRKIYDDAKSYSMVGIYDFMVPVLMIRETELIKTVLQTNFSNFSENAVFLDPKLDPLVADPFVPNNPFVLTDEKWLASRKRLTYAFSSMRLKILLESAKKMINGKAEFEIKSLCARYTAQVVAGAGFGVDRYCFDDSKKEISFRKKSQAIFEPSTRHSIMFSLLFLIPSLNKIFQMSFVPKHVDHFFRTLVADLMEQRRKDRIPRNDFLQLMAELELAEGDKFDIETLTGQSLSFIIDGYETSSIVMSFICFHLASYPKVQEKLREEVLSMLNKYHGAITYEGLKEMTYMDQILNESLKKVPAGTIIKKRCTEEFELRGSDGLVYRIKPGMERFVYFPFGEGPRICVGMKMAQLQIKAGLTIILRKYSMEVLPKTRLPLQLIPGAILPTVKSGLWVNFRKL